MFVTRDDLARLALELLDLQRTYFRLKPGEPGKQATLVACRAAEQELRHACETILEGPPLFPHPEEDDR